MYRLPVISTIDGFVETRTRAAGGRIDIPWRAPCLPHRGVDHFWITGLEREVDGTGGVIVAEYPGPVRAAVAGPEHAALRIRSIRVAERRDID